VVFLPVASVIGALLRSSNGLDRHGGGIVHGLDSYLGSSLNGFNSLFLRRFVVIYHGSQLLCREKAHLGA